MSTAAKTLPIPQPDRDRGHDRIAEGTGHPERSERSPAAAALKDATSDGARRSPNRSDIPLPAPRGAIPVVTTIADLQEALADTARGFVPTMGALHAGHAALIARAAAENAQTVVSIFVNPTQFDDPADLARYPRSLDHDAAVAAEHDATLIFAPTADEMYPPAFATAVEVPSLAGRWEGAARPGHFRGVATVVARLLGLVRPRRAYFGEKDFQQLQIIRRLHGDLALPGEIVACPTVRELDGLALSSRNIRLSPEARRAAAALPRALAAMARLAGEVDETAAIVAAGERVLGAEPAMRLDYLAVVEPTTLKPLSRLGPGARAIVAVEVGGVRLIDNLELAPEAAAWGS